MTGQITTAAVLDYETMASHEVTVTVSDGEATDEVAVTIMVNDVNEAPMFDADTAERSVAENSAAGEAVRRLSGRWTRTRKPARPLATRWLPPTMTEMS
jgi:hypothetical protein